MQVLKNIIDLNKHLLPLKTEKKRIGFVPTMGALHEGHLTLILEALQQNDIVVCSIFVNPTQFNDPKDLELYPRPIEDDIKALTKMGCHLLFLPTATEIYPPDFTELSIDLEGLDKSMEGAHRPGHFKGVVQVVHRFLTIIQPDSLYMGQKDFQQYTIIAHLLRRLKSSIKLICVPIVREPDGLAMSSRNVRLTTAGRSLAPVLHKVLMETQYYVQSQPFPTPQKAKELALTSLAQQGIHKIDYFELVDGHTLQSLDTFENIQYAVACATIEIDGIRLLDNIILLTETL